MVEKGAAKLLSVSFKHCYVLDFWSALMIGIKNVELIPKSSLGH